MHECFVYDCNLVHLRDLLLLRAPFQAFFGFLGAKLGGAKILRGTLRVLVGGCSAMGITYGVGRAFNVNVAG